MQETVRVKDYLTYCNAAISAINRNDCSEQWVHLYSERNNYLIEIARAEYRLAIGNEYMVIQERNFRDFYLWFSSNKDKVEKVKYA